MNIQSFADSARVRGKGKVKAAILERWNTRVVPRGLDKLGRAGARAYLDSYGKGISPAKVNELALCAEIQGASEMAAGFWETSFEMETGTFEPFGASAGSSALAAPTESRAAGKGLPTLPEIPEDMQPGRISTMQPDDPKDDAAAARLHFVASNEYLGQPKRDGHRNVLFATADVTFHQSRSTKSLGMLAPEFEMAAKKAAEEIGPFVLDGERYYRSVLGSEHRTAAQAATANAEAGSPQSLPIAVFGAFEAIFAQGRDLRNATKEERIAAAALPVAVLHSNLPEGCRDTVRVEAVPTARTHEEKRELVSRQEMDGREGEVWTQKTAAYTAGKSHRESFRTKYAEEMRVRIIGVELSKAQGRTLASFLIADETGPCGSIGSGFDEATGAFIVERFQTSPEGLEALILCHGKTEKGNVWNGRFLELI